jgi:hypothetical protein
LNSGRQGEGVKVLKKCECRIARERQLHAVYGEIQGSSAEVRIRVSVRCRQHDFGVVVVGWTRSDKCLQLLLKPWPSASEDLARAAVHRAVRSNYVKIGFVALHELAEASLLLFDSELLRREMVDTGSLKIEAREMREVVLPRPLQQDAGSGETRELTCRRL